MIHLKKFPKNKTRYNEWYLNRHILLLMKYGKKENSKDITELINFASKTHNVSLVKELLLYPSVELNRILSSTIVNATLSLMIVYRERGRLDLELIRFLLYRKPKTHIKDSSGDSTGSIICGMIQYVKEIDRKFIYTLLDEI